MDELLFNFLLKILILFLLPLTVSGSRRELTVEVKIYLLSRFNFYLFAIIKLGQRWTIEVEILKLYLFAMLKLGQKWTIHLSKKLIS